MSDISPSPEKDDLGRRALRGAAVTLGAQGAKVVIQLGSVVILARLLDPGDYGLIAMVATVVGVGELLRDFGLSSAAVQAKHLSRAQRDNLLWLNGAIGAVLALLLLTLGAPALERLYGEPEVVGIAHALSALFVVNGFTTQYRASLVRRMAFRSLARADVVAPLIALALAVGAALLGFGYWALIIQQLGQAVILLLMVSTSAGWMPRWYRRGEPMRGLIRFGADLVGSQLVGYVSNNVDNLLIGIRFGPSQLGYYSRAFQLLMTPLNQVRTPLTTVALPVLSRLQDEQQRFSDYIARAQLAIGYTVVVGLAVVVGGAEPVTLVLLGEQWRPVAPILALLAAAGIFQMLNFVGYWVYTARGLTASLFRYSLISAAIKIIAVAVGSLGGVLGVATGYAIAPAITWPLSIWWLSRITPLPTARLYKGAGRVLVLASCVTAASFGGSIALAPAGPAVQLIAVTMAGAAAYAGTILVIPAMRRDFAMVLDLVRVVVPRRTNA